MSLLMLLGLLVVVPSVLSNSDCRPGTVPYPMCKDWHIGIDRVNPRGSVVHGHANFPIHEGSSGTATGQVHGSQVLGGPYNGAQTVGGKLNYQHNNGLHGGVGATHTKGLGNSYSATVGGSSKVGPGTLTVGGGASTLPGSSKVQGQVGATYSVPLP